MESDIRATVRRHDMAAFATLTLVLSWGWWLLAPEVVGTDELSQGLAIPGAFGPAVAAGVVVWASGDSLRGWASQLLRWRVSVRWYLVAVCLPVGLVLAGVGVALVLVGGPFDLSVLPERLPLFAAAFLVATLVGGGQEELGWRGFALPRLQETYGALAASLVVGTGWAIWHLPLFVLGAPRNQTGSFVLYGALVVGFSILLTWQYNSTGGSVLLAMLLHGGINASGNLLPAPFAAVDRWPLAIDIGLLAGVWVVAAAVLVWRDTESLSKHGTPDPAGLRS